MKSKFIKLIVITFLIFNMTGCAKYLKDGKEILKNEQTGQNLAADILCKPTDKNTLKTYEDYNKKYPKNKLDIEALPSCEEMGIVSKNYSGLWTTIFVQPLAWLIIKIGLLVKNYGLALIISTLLIRLLVYPFTRKMAVQSENMKKAQNKINKIEQKYYNKTDKDSMMKKASEMQMIYKEFDINPFASCLISFIQIPLFIAFYDAIIRIPALFEESFLGFQLGTSPYTALKSGQFIYLILLALVILATYFSFKFNMKDINGEKENQMRSMITMMIVIMAITAFSMSSGIAIYWITSNVFTIIQNILVKRRVKK